jgi:hypothetical protein
VLCFHHSFSSFLAPAAPTFVFAFRCVYAGGRTIGSERLLGSMDRSTARPYFIRRWTSAPALSTPYRYGGEQRRERNGGWRCGRGYCPYFLPVTSALIAPTNSASSSCFLFVFFLFYLFFFIVVSLNLFLILRRRSVCVHILKYIHTDCLLGIRGFRSVCVSGFFSLVATTHTIG